MRNKHIFLTILTVFFGIFLFTSCENDEEVQVSVKGAFTDPVVVAPLNGAALKITGTTVDLKWSTTDADGDSPVCDVYFGTSEEPPLYKANHTGLSLTVPVVEGAKYYWYVKMYDANKVMTTSHIWSFNVLVNYNIDNFVGNYECNEPGYGKYICKLKKIDASTVESDNFWDSGLALKYKLDEKGNVTIVTTVYPKVQLSATLTADIEISGTGKFNNKTYGFEVEYYVKDNNKKTTVFDHNVHTFVKK